MKIQAQKWILAASVISTVAGPALEAQACGGARRSGVSRVVAQIHSARTSNRYSAPTPSYRSIQPTYRQAPVYHNAAVNVQPSPVASQSFSNQPIAGQTVSGQSFAPQQPVQQPFNQQPAQGNFAGQQVPAQQVQQQAASVQQPARQPSAPSQQPASIQQQSTVQQQAPVQQQAQPAVQPAPATQPAASAEASALAMLASVNQRAVTPTQASAPTQAAAPAPTPSQIPTFGTATSASSVSSPAQPHVGSWNVSLPGEQSVSLKLDSDGSFVWVASKSGSTSQFSGQYRLDGGSLTLVRSEDQQKMEGTWTPSQNGGFVFRVGGGTNGGLSFTRS
ncbi:putative signal peptide protein [Rhodopirellula islandica]|uniref:Signal peptide protein n=1 Tax=Rhodopirellula islandica TaxID=595434 RepID=A0A0J1BML7_RHOIS|nr:hypothetical protein [Rhodopirellula islandica]KLU07703.1 putative signal peptide protein [Rhodopirellula islandica]